jgi:hypothetical protein
MRAFRMSRMVNEADGALERAPGLPIASWTVPATVEIGLRGLYWLGEGKRIESGKGMLANFIALADCDEDQFEERVLEYARRWGVLRLCREWFPATDEACAPCRMYDHRFTDCIPDWHRADDPRDTRIGPIIEGPYALPDEPEISSLREYYREPFLPWRVYALAARTIMRCAAAIHQNSAFPRAYAFYLTDWETAYELREVERLCWISAAQLDANEYMPQFAGWIAYPLRDESRVVVTAAVNCWLRMGAVRFGYEWLETGPRLSITYPGLFGALGVQLMQSVSRSNIEAQCHECGDWFFPRRKPRAGQRTYCAKLDCQAAAVRNRKRSQRERQRQHDDKASFGTD